MKKRAPSEAVTTRLLSVPEAADRLGLRPATVRFWIWTRQIDYIKVGRAVRLREETIADLIRRGTVPARRGAEVRA